MRHDLLDMETPAPRPFVYHLLLLGLLLLFPLHALEDSAGTVGSLVLAVGNAVSLLGCMIALNRGWLRYVALVLGVPALIMGFMEVSDGELFWVSRAVLSIIIYLFMIVVLTRTVFRSKRFGVSDVSAALSIYLIVGLLWAKLYGLLYVLDEHSFVVNSGIEAGRESPLFYFSFVTLTTLGYGDISPASPLAMSLATLEAIVGQFFMVVGVATVVARAGVRPAD